MKTLLSEWSQADTGITICFLIMWITQYLNITYIYYLHKGSIYQWLFVLASIMVFRCSCYSVNPLYTFMCLYTVFYSTIGYRSVVQLDI